jgi:hypothetical protein
MWFGKAVDDFNTSITSQGQHAPQLIAATGNAFTSESNQTFFVDSDLTRILAVVWVAYAFYAIPVITSLTKLNVTATKQ